MTLKKELMQLRQKAIMGANQISGEKNNAIEESTNEFFELGKSRLKAAFDINPTASHVQTVFDAHAADYQLLKRLFENNLLDKSYLKSLGEVEGIEIAILENGVTYPSIGFDINLINTKENITSREK